MMETLKVWNLNPEDHTIVKCTYKEKTRINKKNTSQNCNIC